MLSESLNKIDYSASFLACSPKYHCLWSSDSVGLKIKHSTCCINFSPKDFYVLCRAIAVDQEDENMPVISTHWNSICCPNDDYDYTKWNWCFFLHSFRRSRNNFCHIHSQTWTFTKSPSSLSIQLGILKNKNLSRPICALQIFLAVWCLIEKALLTKAYTLPLSQANNCQ